MDCPICRRDDASRLYEAVRDLEHYTDQLASFAACPGCGALFQSPPPDPASLRLLYPATYRAGNAVGLYGRLKQLQALLLARRLRTYISRSDANILELGSGAGQLLQAFARLGFSRLSGVDWTIPAELAADAPAISFVAHDITTYLPPQPVDVLIVNNVIEHLADPLKLLRRYRNRLSEEGVVLALTPNAQSLCHRFFGRYWSGLHAPWHVHVFTQKSLAILSERAGMQIRDLVVNEDPGSWAISVQNYWRRAHKNSADKSGFSPVAALALAGCAPIALAASAIGRGSSLLAVLERRA